MQIKIYRDNRIIMDIKPPYRSSPLTLTNCHHYKARESTCCDGALAAGGVKGAAQEKTLLAAPG